MCEAKLEHSVRPPLTHAMDYPQVLQDLHLQRSHRDIKPANLMLSGWIKGKVNLTLVDWASSRLHSQGELLQPASLQRLCKGEAVMLGLLAVTASVGL